MLIKTMTFPIIFDGINPETDHLSKTLLHALIQINVHSGIYKRHDLIFFAND